MTDEIQNTVILCEYLDRLTKAIESLHADLKPEIKKTNTLERIKREMEEIKSAAAHAVRCHKQKNSHSNPERPSQSVKG